MLARVNGGVTGPAAEGRAGSGAGLQVERALDVLEHLASAGDAARSLSEIAEVLGQPKATTHRLLAVLRRRGYLTQDDRSRYRLGVKCFELGNRWSASFDLGTFARPHLEALNRELGETVHLAVYDQGDVVYVDKLEGTQQVIARPDTGNRAPATVVATGRSLLAFQPAEEIRAQLARPLPGYTDSTPTSPEQVAELLRQVRRDGYSVNRETYRTGICGLAAPIRDSTATVIASVGIVVPAHRFADGDFDRLRDRTVATAVGISAELGGPDALVTSAG
jgi:DNA-binding IclR family transcriptional regulator